MSIEPRPSVDAAGYGADLEPEVPGDPAAASARLAALVADLQARGLRVEAPMERRQGGAGPSDSGMLWVGGFPITVTVVMRSRSDFRELPRPSSKSLTEIPSI